jgi:hypothetical protein
MCVLQLEATHRALSLLWVGDPPGGYWSCIRAPSVSSSAFVFRPFFVPAALASFYGARAGFGRIRLVVNACAWGVAGSPSGYQPLMAAFLRLRVVQIHLAVPCVRYTSGVLVLASAHGAVSACHVVNLLRQLGHVRPAQLEANHGIPSPLTLGSVIRRVATGAALHPIFSDSTDFHHNTATGGIWWQSTGGIT